MKNSKKKFIAGLTSVMLVSSSIVSIASGTATTKESVQSYGFEKYEEGYVFQSTNSFLKDINNLDKSENPKKITMYQPEERVRFIVELQEESIYDNNQRDGAMGLSTFSVDLENNILQSQEYVISQVRSMEDITIRNRYTTLINGFSGETEYRNIDKIKTIPGIKSVTVAQRYLPDMNSSKDMITNINHIWKELGYDGEGVVVSIIDSGIDYLHHDMALSPSTVGELTEGEVNNLKGRLNAKDGKYFTEKVPFGFNYASTSIKGNGPLDILHLNNSTPHGSHVAGIVAANCPDPVKIEKNEGIKGVAPEAQVLAMKVFSNDPKNPYSYSDDIIAAIEDSVKLGANVINMSLGSAAGFQNEEGDPQIAAIRKAAESGVMVVVSAGNDSYATYASNGGVTEELIDQGLVGSPGLANDALQVASMENKRMVHQALRYMKFDGSQKGTAAMIPTQSTNIKVDLNGNYEVVDCGYGSPDDFKSVNVRGKIAMVQRGGMYNGNVLNFSQKQEYAAIAGAAAVIVYNDEDRGDELVNMQEGRYKIPALFVGHNDGMKLIEGRDFIVSFKGDTIEVENPVAWQMSDFTSWGPTPNLDFKPEITGVGGNVWSTVGDNGFQNQSGTSMSSPFVAGFMAIYTQYMKDQGMTFDTPYDKVQFIKGNAVNTANVIYEETERDGNIPVSPRRQGAGSIDIDGMLNNKVSVRYGVDNDPTIALKEIGNQVSIPINITNYGTEAAYFRPELLNNEVYTQQDYLYGEGVMDNYFNMALEGAEVTFSYTKSTIDTTTGSAIKFDGITPEAKEPKVTGTQNPTEGKAKESVESTTGSAITLNPNVPADALKVLPGETVTIVANLTIPEGVSPDKFVEGFIKFTPLVEGLEEVGIPFMGFYGDWGALPIFETPAFEGNLDNQFTGISRVSYYDEDGDGFLDFIPDYPELEKEFFVLSPKNEISRIRGLMPVVHPLRNIKDATLYVKDAAGNLVKTLGTVEYIRKVYNPAYPFFFDESWVWDGTDEMGEVVPDGDYTMTIKARVDYEGAEYQEMNFPVEIDTKPAKGKVFDVVQDADFQGLTLQYDTPKEDKADKAMVIIEDLETGKLVYLTQLGINPYFPVEPSYNEETGKYEIKVRRLPFKYNNIEIHIFDYAENFGIIGRKIVTDVSQLGEGESRLNVTLPAAGQVYDINEPITVQYNYAGTGVASYEIQYMNATEKFEKITTTETQATLNNLPVGENVIVVKALDENGNTLSLAAVNLNVENTVPSGIMEVIDLTNPSQFELGKEANVQLQVRNLTNKEKGAVVVVGLFDSRGKLVSTVKEEHTMASQSSQLYTLNMMLPEEGQYTLRAFVWDSLQNREALCKVKEYRIK